jgi:hypothetical protein
MNTPFPGIQLGIVVAAYPHGNAVDVLLPDSGSRLTNVQVMVSSGSDSSGTVDLPDPGIPLDDNRWNLPPPANSKQIIAVIQSYKGSPVCTGFILPQVCQMTFDRKNFRVFRHASDVYSTINESGDTEVYHPSGTFLRIGASPTHEDLTGQDFDGDWAIKNNTAAAVWVNLTVANGGVVKASLKIDPSGNVTLTSQGNFDSTVQGDLTLNVTGNISATANRITLNGVTIDSSGNLTSPATIKGSTDVIAGPTDISVVNHDHTSASPGSPTSPPIPGT